MTIDNLEKKLNECKLDSLYLLYGEETYLLETSVKKIKKIFGKTMQGINYIMLDDTNVDRLIGEIETPAFGFEKKLIIVKDSGLFKKEIKSKTKNNTTLSEKIAKYIEENAKEIDKTAIIIFIEKEIGKNVIIDVIEKYGTVCNFEKLKPAQIINRLKKICLAYKVNVDEKTLQFLIETCGTNMLNLINEIRKLIEYVGTNGTITNNEIEMLSIKELDSVIFDLTDSLGQKKTGDALRILNELIYNKEPIQKILVTLYNHFKKIYLCILAQKSNRNIVETLGLKPNQVFLTTKYKKQASYFKEEELKQILIELINLDYKYKQGLIDINIGLEAILACYT